MRSINFKILKITIKIFVNEILARAIKEVVVNIVENGSNIVDLTENTRDLIELSQFAR